LAVNNVFSANSYSSTDCGWNDYLGTYHLNYTQFGNIPDKAITPPSGTLAIDAIDIVSATGEFSFRECLSKYIYCGSN
jgi:hypothetical protein